jgi:hypothetical protein
MDDGTTETRTESYSSDTTMEATKRGLERQLSHRSTVRELMERRILKFTEDIKVVEVEGKEEYDRRCVGGIKTVRFVSVWFLIGCS